MHGLRSDFFVILLVENRFCICIAQFQPLSLGDYLDLPEGLYEIPYKVTYLVFASGSPFILKTPTTLFLWILEEIADNLTPSERADVYKCRVPPPYLAHVGVMTV